MVPIGKELMTENVNRVTVFVKIVAEAHIDYSLLAAASLRTINRMVSSYVKFWRFIAWYNESSTRLGVDSQVACDSEIESLKVEVHINVIKKDVACAQSDIGIDEVIIILSVTAVDSGLLNNLRDSSTNKRLACSSVGLANVAELAIHGDYCLEFCLVFIIT